MAKFNVSFAVGADALGSVLAALSKMGVGDVHADLATPPANEAGKPVSAAKPFTPAAAPKKYKTHKRLGKAVKRGAPKLNWWKRRYKTADGGQRKVVLEALKARGQQSWAELDEISTRKGFAYHSISPELGRLMNIGEIVRVARGLYELTPQGAAALDEFNAKKATAEAAAAQ